MAQKSFYVVSMIILPLREDKIGRRPFVGSCWIYNFEKLVCEILFISNIPVTFKVTKFVINKIPLTTDSES